MSAVKFFGENHLHLSNVIAARIGRGLKELPPIKGYASSMVIIWRPGGPYVQFLEPSKHDAHHVERVRFDMERTDWAQLRVLQLLCENHNSALQDILRTGGVNLVHAVTDFLQVLQQG